jgi:5-methylcytosine-specific restriction protein A
MADPFTERALQIYEDARTQIGYVASRFRQKIIRDGGLAAAKHWLRPSKATEGFRRLLDEDCLHLSVEAVALQPPWNALFTPEELATARDRLALFGYFSAPPPTPSSQISPDELVDESSYPEGAKTAIIVNAYERDPEARRRCIEHYGAVCFVCDFDFEKTYGQLGVGFIHVHHLTPFGSVEGPRRTNPIADLRPVCPNCHSMLHRRSPPISIAALKRQLHGADGGRVRSRGRRRRARRAL